MSFNTFSKKHLLFLSLILCLCILITSKSYAAWKWSYISKKANIEGYVFIDKRFTGTIKSVPEVEKLDRKDFFKNILDGYKHLKPLSGAEIAFGGNSSKSQTNEAGFFKMNPWWLTARKKEIKVTAPGAEVTFKLDLDSLQNLFFIKIPNDGSPKVFCLKETQKDPKLSNAVILVHGFGVDFGPFTLSRHRNSWEKASKLFESDPDLSRYDFYMPDHWDDQSLVKSSQELGCFLRLVRHAYGPNAKIIILAHSAGGLIVRHYTVSKFFEPGTVDGFVMLATPNGGSFASLIHIEPDIVTERNRDGTGAAAQEILSYSDFLNCLNNMSQMPLACKNTFLIDKSLQGLTGLNPDIPCAIVAGEVRGLIINLLNKLVDAASGTSFEETFDSLMNFTLNKIPQGDVLVSLENQLIRGIPFYLLPAPHGFIHRPKDGQDDRYLIMKRFILTEPKEWRKKPLQVSRDI